MVKAAVVTALVALCVPVAGAEPYLQYGGDAGRTGFLVDPGPETWDLAFQVASDLAPVARAGPVILDGAAYLLLADDDGNGAIWRLELDTAAFSSWYEVPGPFPYSLASDGERLFFVAGDAIHGIRIEDQELWSHTPDFDVGPVQRCLDLAVTDVVTAICEVAAIAPNEMPVTYTNYRNDAARWAFIRLGLDGELIAERLLDIPSTDGPGDVTSLDLLAVDSVAVVDDRTLIGIEGKEGFRARVQALDEAGRLDWTYDFEPFRNPGSPTIVDDLRDAHFSNTHVAVWGSRVIALANHAAILDDDGTPARELWFPRTQDQYVLESGAPAFGPGQIFLPVRGGMAAISPGGQILWESPGRDDWQAHSPTLVAGGRVYRQPISGDLIARDADGSEVWRRAMDLDSFGRNSFGIGDGVLVASGEQTRCGDSMGRCGHGTAVSVFGRTDASIQIEAQISDRYPASGGTISVDVSASRPGALADDVEYVVRWGDGQESAGGPIFEHVYKEGGDLELVVQATNSAGQEASYTTTLHVGRSPPNFISDAFAPENQESTFFFLGLILTLLFAGFGVVRLRRKRSRLRRELAAADAILASHRDDPDAMRGALRDHRRRARRLFLDGRLDEGSTSILERHIDELMRDHRLSSVEADLAFLPHGLFRSMQEMLRDAHVTQLERNNFLAALASEKQLTAAQKNRVRKHVETWHREDAA